MRLSVQLYTVRDAMDADPVGTLTKLKSFGLDYVEIAGNAGGSTAAESKKILDDLGLKVSGSHAGFPGLDDNLDKLIEDHLTLECPFVVVPWVGADAYANGWDGFAARLVPIAEKVKAAGLQLAYHNHDFEFQTVNGESGLDLFYRSVSADLIKAELDLAWVSIGGVDPVSYINAHKDRVSLVHLKDYNPEATPRWVPAGSGVMDLAGCVAAATAVGAHFGVVELDESPADPLDAVEASVKYLNSLGLK